MIAAARRDAAAADLSKICTFEVADVQHGFTPSLATITQYDKVFSNAAMHWILKASTSGPFFDSVHAALKPSGQFVFEMGGMGNVAEMRSTLLGVLGRRVGMAQARAADPWFFPDESWMRARLEASGFAVERLEREWRPTRADEGGIEGWVRLMGKQFFDVVPVAEEREECVREVCEVLETVCRSPGGGDWIGYVRLRAVARKV
ncbi:hypothetical protein BP6252_07000 [Coleophoma cylindrospora]|uniref:Methyltransferase type 11 domain-containing protein n=1 Tax=Coleophoma cylindrospora TaxID=1849047 RepID=A0A3D8RG98_9HELO|nr:hypothetical protein BP6252_07000 [Coleophoma cylindrospora]